MLLRSEESEEKKKKGILTVSSLLKCLGIHKARRGERTFQFQLSC